MSYKMEDHKEANIIENKLSVGAFYHYSAAFWGEDIYVEGIVVYNDGATAVIRVTDRYEECEFDVLYYKEVKQILPFFIDPEAKRLTEYLCMDVETEVCLFSRNPDDSTIMYRTLDEDGIRNLVPADFKKVRIERFSKMVECELKIREDAEKTYGLGYGLSEGELYHHPVSEETYVEGIVLLNDGYTAVIRVTDRYSECFFEILHYNEVRQMFPFFIDPFYDPEAKRLPEYLCLDVETESNLFFRDPDDDTIMHWVTDENGNWSLVPADFVKVRMEQFKKEIISEIAKMHDSEKTRLDNLPCCLIDIDVPKADIDNMYREYDKKSGNTNSGSNEVDYYSLNRSYHWLTNRSCAILSAWRGSYSRKENDNRNRKLQKSLRNLGYGVIRVKGCYAEMGREAEKENSFLVFDLDDTPDFKERIYEQSEYYEQDCFLYKPIEGMKAYLIGSNDDFGKHKETDAGFLHINYTFAEHYSEVGSGRFSFETETQVAERLKKFASQVTE